MSKLLDKTAALEPNQPNHRPPRPDSPRTAPGRMFDYASRINEAEDRAIAATSEAEQAKQQLQDALAQVEALKQAGGSTAGVIEIDISTLVEVPGRRRVLSPTEYEELKANLAESDLVHPVVYRPIGDGRNEIVAGNNRVAIYRDELKRNKILGIPFNGDAKQAELGATFSNLLAPSLPDFEKYRQFLRLQEEFGFTRPDIIKASGLSNSHVARILAFDNLPTAAKDAIAKRPDRVGGHAAEEFVALTKNGNAEAVVSAIEKLVGDESMTQKRALELARPKTPKAAAPTARTINIGKKKLCEMTVRNGVVGLRFTGKQGDTTADEWADKIETFIRAQIGEQSKE
jgi:ParB family transcriptional regulator, chromosome partitioning protein